MCACKICQQRPDFKNVTAVYSLFSQEQIIVLSYLMCHAKVNHVLNATLHYDAKATLRHIRDLKRIITGVTDHNISILTLQKRDPVFFLIVAELQCIGAGNRPPEFHCLVIDHVTRVVQNYISWFRTGKKYDTPEIESMLSGEVDSDKVIYIKAKMEKVYQRQ